MFSNLLLRPVAVITTIVGLVASQSTAVPPQIYSRVCNPPQSTPAVTRDCQNSIDLMALTAGYISGREVGCLEMAASGSCVIRVCVPASIRASAIAVAAADIFGVCKPVGSNSHHVVAGQIQMNGFTTSTGGIGNEVMIFLGGSIIASSKREIDSIDGLSTREADPVDNNVSPTRTHGRDLHLPHRVQVRTPAPTYLVSGGLELWLSDSQMPSRELDSGAANALVTNTGLTWRMQYPTDNVAYATVNTGDGVQAAMGYHAANNNDLGSVDPTDHLELPYAMNEFRNQQGNPGWFAVQVMSLGELIGWMVLDVGPGHLL